jgi:hypothetical protein
MSKLATLDHIYRNAAHVLGKPGSRRWQVFDAVNGRFTSPEIADSLGIARSNCANDVTELFNKGLIEEAATKGPATVYRKIPELRNVNLRPYVRTAKEFRSPKLESASEHLDERSVLVGLSKTGESVVNIAKRYEIANIDQNWIDALIVLNFIETSLTKFLMDHGYTEAQIEKMHWDDKAVKVRDKLFEEANKKGTRPRQIILSNLSSYRTNRNTLDHEAHLPEANIRPHEVALLLKLLQSLNKEIFDEHKSYCLLPK